jgi:protein-S-isoprenylcysteine O-methyltransferase Ste14
LYPALGAITVLGWPWLWLCQRYGRWTQQDDHLAALGHGWLALLRRRKPDSRFYDELRSTLVKFFFLPMILGFFRGNADAFANGLAQLAAQPAVFQTPWITDLAQTMVRGLFTIDVAIGAIGYFASTRLLDTQVRTAEPTVFGWLVCVACYNPFIDVTRLYTGLGFNENRWRYHIHDPTIALMFTVISVASIAVYTWATLSFGIRFSNLTNRGIISKGPYAIVRHPAYACKNLCWWLLCVPYLVSIQAVVQLMLVNGLYVLRALTEERHLSRDPHYREYMKQVVWRFVPGVV